MTKDRLGDLIAGAEDNENNNEEDDVTICIEEQQDLMDSFFTEIAEIRDVITKIDENVIDIKTLHGSILSAPSQDEQTKINLEELNESVKKMSNMVRSRIKRIQDSIVDDSYQFSGADKRIREIQHSMLSKLFLEVMTKYNKIQTEHREKCKARIQRQLEITGRSTTGDELEEMLENGNISVFTKDIIMDTQLAKQSLADIQARHEDIIKLEKSIKDLHQMFIDMAMLIESQGEMVDRIEYHVEHTKDHVQEAIADTKKAVEYQSKARKKKIIIIACLSIAALILIIWLITFFSTK